MSSACRFSSGWTARTYSQCSCKGCKSKTSFNLSPQLQHPLSWCHLAAQTKKKKNVFLLSEETITAPCHHCDNKQDEKSQECRATEDTGSLWTVHTWGIPGEVSHEGTSAASCRSSVSLTVGLDIPLINVREGDVHVKWHINGAANHQRHGRGFKMTVNRLGEGQTMRNCCFVSGKKVSPSCCSPLKHYFMGMGCCCCYILLKMFKYSQLIPVRLQ